MALNEPGGKAPPYGHTPGPAHPQPLQLGSTRVLAVCPQGSGQPDVLLLTVLLRRGLLLPGSPHLSGSFQSFLPSHRAASISSLTSSPSYTPTCLSSHITLSHLCLCQLRPLFPQGVGPKRQRKPPVPRETHAPPCQAGQWEIRFQDLEGFLQTCVPCHPYQPQLCKAPSRVLFQATPFLETWVAGSLQRIPS